MIVNPLFLMESGMVALNARMQHERNYDDEQLAKRGLKRLDIDPKRIEMGWVLDFCAQGLRNIVIGLGGNKDGYLMMLLGKNATVTVCHTKTVDLPAIARQADILVSAAGVLNSLTKDFVRPGQIVIDVSINWDPSKKDGKGGIAGDAVFSEVEPIVEAITPVPGGVGTVTSSVLVGHVVEAAERTLA